MAYSRDGFPHSLPAGLEQSFISAPLNTGVPILDQDLNIMQSIQLSRSNDSMAQLYTCGWVDKGALLNFGINNFEMAASVLVCHDRTKMVTDTQLAGTNRIDVPTTVGRPAGQTFDIVFIELWIEEIRETGTVWKWGNVLNFDPAALTNNVVDPAVGLTAAARMQDRYRIRVVSEVDSNAVTAMTSDPVTIQGKKASPALVGNPLFNFNQNTVDNFFFVDTTVFDPISEWDDFDGTVVAFPIALVERTVGDDDLNNGTVTDLREKLAIKVTSFSPTFSDPSECAIEVGGQLVSSEVIDVVDSGNSVTIDFCDGNVHFIDLAPATGDVTVVLNNPVAGGIYHLSFKQHPTTPVQLIWPGEVDFLLGFAHLLTLVGGDVDVFQLIRTSNPSYRTFPMGPRTISLAPSCQQDITVTGPVVVDFNVCQSYRLFLSSAPDPFDLTLINAQAGGAYSIKFVQGAAGNTQANYINTLTWLNAAGSQENLTSVPFGIDIVIFYFDGSGFCAKLEGQNGVPAAPGAPTVGGLADVTFGGGPFLNDSLFFDGVAWSNSFACRGAAFIGTGLSQNPISGFDVSGNIQSRGLLGTAAGTSGTVNSGELIVSGGGANIEFSTTAELNQGVNPTANDAQVFQGRLGTGQLAFRTLIEGTNITFSQAGDGITINAGGGGGGTVTSVSQGAGITCTPNPITGAGTVSNAGVISIGTGVGLTNFATAQNPVIGVSAGIGVWGANGVTGNIPGAFTNFASSGTIALSGLLMVISGTARVAMPASGVIEARLLHNNAVIAGSYTMREAVPGNGEIQIAINAVVTSATASGNIILQLRDTGSGTPVCNGCNVTAVQRLG